MAGSIVDMSNLLKVFNETGRNQKQTARILGVSRGTVVHHLDKAKNMGLIEESSGYGVGGPARQTYTTSGPQRINVNTSRLACDTVVVFSDAHYWPGKPSLAHQALLKLLPQIKPGIVVANGDVFDGASISRFDPDGWEKVPDIKQELDICIERMGEVERAAKGAQLFWTTGNHDSRYERYLRAHADKFRDMPFFTLQEHFPKWKRCVSLMLNDNTMIKHAFRSGVHAVWNNTLNSGVNIVTGHLHQLKVTPFSDYRGRRYGVDTGFMGHVSDSSFNYALDNPKNWCAGFAVLTFDESGELLPPELVEVLGDKVYFRGARVNI